ncbi:MAG: T9SS type A sorting domain-containing protein [Bacteroidales bacterium]|nr:T9SS type A sorting domain-containing protein [Bacteroidales bacterium]
MNCKVLSLFLFFIGLSFAVGAQTQEISFDWYSAAVAEANAQNKAQTTVYGTKVDDAGYVYTLASMGSDADTTGDVVATQGHLLGEDMTGAPYSGTSYNNNIMLVKHDFNGNALWKIYSKNGDVDVSSSDYTPTADGGAFLALKARHTSANFYGNDILLQLVGNNGTETTISFSFPDAEYHNVYQPVFVKVDADGNISSAVRATVDWNPVDNPASSYTWGISDGFSLYGAAQDANGNFFVTGNLRRTMHIGENEILAHNVADWDGGSGFAGSAFVLKLNSDLTYNSHIVTGGSSVGETAKQMKYKDGKLYVAGYLKGSNAVVSLGDSQVTPDDKYSFWTARVNASDLSVDYLSLVQGAQVNNKNFMQLNALEIAPDNSSFFVAGGIQGGFKIGQDTVSAQGTMYAGFVFRCNSATGVADKGFVKQTSGISNSFGLAVNADSVFVYGYNWATTPKSLYFDSFNRNLETSASHILGESTGSITANSCAVKGDSLLIAARVQANKALNFAFAETATSYTSTYSWQGVVAKYTFPGYEFTAPAPQTYTITLNVGENGTVTTEPESLTDLLADTEVVFTISPAEGYELDEFKVDGEAVAVENNTYTLTVTADATVDVTFKLIPIEPETYTITLNVGENGTVTTEPESLTDLLADTEVVFTISPAEGYELDEFKVDGEAVAVENNTYTLTVTADAIVDVTFKLATSVLSDEARNIEIYSYESELVISGAEGLNVMVYNMLGQVVESFAVVSDVERHNLPQGMYIVKVGDNDTEKILVR